MKPRIALVTGGYSGEAEVSYGSANTIQKNIDRNKFDLYRIDITRDGWYYTNTEGVKSTVNKNDFSIHIGSQKILFDGVLIAIHGTPGEDGKLQGYFDMLEIPYTTCDAGVSSITFNKRYTVAVASFSGITVSRSVLLFKEDSTKFEFLAEAKKLKFPVFVKPNNGGSSIGTTKVDKKESLDNAVARALKEDSQVLVEEFIPGREFTIGVYKTKGNIVPLPVTEIISKKEFFDFEAKYHGASNEVTPAEIDNALKNLIQTQAVKIYKIFNCSGVVRIDFIYNSADRKLYMLEINTVPGQTDASLVPQQILSAGGNLKDFYSAQIEECLRKKEK
ncbi:MAG: D-alanine--D-alanine ligase [Chitinophagaceae bacterium]|nr:D-alanine--D-alanine ligase [Chitinophagaceae bacterium]